MENNKRLFKLINTIKNHWYFIKDENFPTGIDMPSVTTILDCFPNPGLNHWRETTSPEEIKEKQEEGKIQGSKVHHTAYLLSIGEKINMNNGLTKEQIAKLPLETSDDKQKDLKLLNYLKEPYTDREIRSVKAFLNYWAEFKPITRERELHVYHKDLLYAGTLDWAGYLWSSKENKYEPWIIGYKISSVHSQSYESQIMAYYKALCRRYDKKYRIKLGLLYLGKPTKKMFQLKEVIDKQRAWDDFISTKKLWHSINPNAKPKTKEILDEVSVDITHKKKGKLIKFNN